MIGRHDWLPRSDPDGDPAAERSWTVGLRLPEHWFVISGQPEKDQEQAPAEVDAELRRRPELEVFRDAMLDPLLGLSGTLARLSGRVCAALRWELTDYGLVTATVIVRCYERPAGPVDGEVEVMGALASEQQPMDEFAPQVSVVDLTLGRAVRREVVIQPPAERDTTSPLRLMVDHWVPLNFAPTRTLGIRASTANLAMSATLVPEFDAIAQGCVIRPGERPENTSFDGRNTDE